MDGATTTKMVAGQPFTKFEIWIHAVPAKLTMEAAQRRNMAAAELIAEICGGVLTKGCIGKALEFYSDWKLTKRLREADGNNWRSTKRARL